MRSCVALAAVIAMSGRAGAVPCEAGLFCQPFGNLDAFAGTPGVSLCAEDFTPAADGSITQLCWQGVPFQADPGRSSRAACPSQTSPM